VSSPSRLETIDGDALEARLDAALDGMGGPDRAALATDGDGTLWTSDVGEALFEQVVERRLVGESARAALLEEARLHGVEVSRAGEGATDIAAAIHSAYVHRRFPEDRVCAMMTWCTAGSTVAALDALSAQMLEGSFDLRARLIPESARVLRWAAARKVPIILVSASPRVVVERAARIVESLYGIALPVVLAMTPKVEAGVMQPSLVGIWTYGEGKAEALSAELAIEQRTLVCAMGDNAFDAAMLRAACVPVAIRPKPALVEVAASIPGLVVAT
jgi:phosphoserine phosphatase